jgi:hypothetical protein
MRQSKTVFLDLETIKAIALENKSLGYKEFQGDITLWKEEEILPGLIVRAYLTFMKNDMGGYTQFTETWINTAHNPKDLLTLDSMGNGNSPQKQ